MTRFSGKTVFVHDWLNGMRGGEKCLDLFSRDFPGAPIYTLLADKGALSLQLLSHPIVPSAFLAKFPLFPERYRWFLPLFPRAVEAFALPEDTRLVVSMSHCVAKGVRPPPGAKHLCYCFTPMRYAWDLGQAYFGGGLKHAALSPFLARLREWDRESAARVDRFVAISECVRRRIAEHYGREAAVVYPPVDLDFYTPDPAVSREDFDLVAGALVPYKRVDLAIDAAKLSGRRLVVAGTGSEEAALRARARGAANISFWGRVGDEELRDLYRRCRCLLFPGEEDFGIVPVEAQACGAPVVAYAAGGALETLAEYETAVFFREQTAYALLAAAEKLDGMFFSHAELRKNAERFSAKRFLRGLHAEVDALFRN